MKNVTNSNPPKILVNFFTSTELSDTYCPAEWQIGQAITKKKGKWRRENLHITKLRVTNKGFPSKRWVEINIVVDVSIFTWQPCEHHHYTFNFSSLFSSPIILSPKTPHPQISPNFEIQAKNLKSFYLGCFSFLDICSDKIMLFCSFFIYIYIWWWWWWFSHGHTCSHFGFFCNHWEPSNVKYCHRPFHFMWHLLSIEVR